MLTAAALTASADATHRRLGGPGRWLLALPAHHIAGLQVLVRSVVAGRAPVAVSPRFDVSELPAAVSAMGSGRRYASMVAAQLDKALADPSACAALAELDAILIGGGPTPARIAEKAAAAGISVVRTYGMSETAGGCVYDGVPLDGVRVRIDPGGRIALGGATLAKGYRNPPEPDPFAEPGWFVTDDVGALDSSGMLAGARQDRRRDQHRRPDRLSAACRDRFVISSAGGRLRGFRRARREVGPARGCGSGSGRVHVCVSDPSGRIALGGATVAKGYRNPPEPDPFAEPGWFVTDDVGALDSSGILRVLGRTDDAISTGGLTVFPQLVETALSSHPRVVDCAVFGVPDERLGQRVVAAVVAADGYPSAIRRRLCRLLRSSLLTYAGSTAMTMAKCCMNASS